MTDTPIDLTARRTDRLSRDFCVAANDFLRVAQITGLGRLGPEETTRALTVALAKFIALTAVDATEAVRIAAHIGAHLPGMVEHIVTDPAGDR